ncbi:hypothetical protein A2W14_07165 [Candidatus Gottesmanbacteria bacterium RBG_16_37_8]|uniref:Uncharacterized protein n=1 Tax=Candidatus Gottesmanbacteria bacterium RBG_16_37_8 TaxID=1798371 RepID=A0A1F5YN81_9BACT|nr:MAG: hypothetical protein A2W14_07165 [Candidatus Gottesmanbacteria bacterium RBG_16_37_8]
MPNKDNVNNIPSVCNPRGKCKIMGNNLEMRSIQPMSAEMRFTSDPPPQGSGTEEKPTPAPEPTPEDIQQDIQQAAGDRAAGAEQAGAGGSGAFRD